MGWFIFSIFVVLLGLGLLLARNAINEGLERDHGAGIIGSLILIAGITLIVLNSFTVVPPRNAGIVVTLGKANTALDSGMHAVPPWSSIETVDATVKNINRSMGAKDVNEHGSITGPCVTVRLANQTTACVDVTAQWNINQHANANELWQRYRGNNDDVVANVGANVVDRQLRVALNDVFESYNPLSVLSGTTDGVPKVSTADLAKSALSDLRLHVDEGIVIDALVISLVHYDDVTQGKLNGYAQALADTQIATQQKLTAEQQRLANEKLATSSSNDAGVKYQNCLNLIKDLAAKGQLQNLPPTFNCGESSAPVIIGK